MIPRKHISNTQGRFYMKNRYYTTIQRHLLVFNIPNLLPVLIPLLISILFIWSSDFFEEGYINWGDTVFQFYPIEYFKGQYYLWNSYEPFGEPTSWTGPLPYYFFIALADRLGIPLWIINRLIFILPMSMIGWFTYYLITSIIKGKYQKSAGLLASIFILLSPVIIAQPKWNVSIATIPLILAFIIRGFENKQERKKYIMLAAFSSFLIPIGDPQFILLVTGLILAYFILQSLLKLRIDLDKVKFLISILFLAILINMYWILPFISSFLTLNVLGSMELLPGQGYSLLTGSAPGGKLFFVERLVLDIPNQLGRYYSIPLVLITSTIIPILVYGSLLLSKDRNILLFSVIAIVITIFSTTINYGWFASIYKYLWDDFSFFHVIRQPVSYLFILQFIYAILLAYLFQQIFIKNINIKIKACSLSIIFSILIVNGIFVLGLAGAEYNPQPTHTPTVKIPSEYKELGEYLRNYGDSESRLLVLPWIGWYVKYSWHDEYDMVEILYHFSPVNVIGIRNYGPVGNEVQLLSYINNNSITGTTYMMDMLGIKYVLVHKDISPLMYQMFPLGIDRVDDYLVMLDQNFTKVMDNKYFVLYQSNSTNIAPSVYVIDPSQLNKSLWEIDNTVSYNIKKINPTYYSGNIVTNKSSILILNQNYNPNWKLYIDGKEINEHFKFNQFNGWSVDTKGKIDIEIKYTLQKYVLPAILVSLTTFIFIAVLLLKIMITSKKEEK